MDAAPTTRRIAFPRAFWIANLMEIFERMGWYGFYGLSSLYLTAPIEHGGLGFTSQDRGVIQGVTTFFLYLFPAVFGALADRYGYRRMFLASATVLVPGYLLLSLPTSFWAFFGVYLLVAVGHGMFKPVVVSTVARTTTAATSAMGFGIFYMMVNVGGVAGQALSGVIRSVGWSYVFFASAAWCAVLGLVCALFYREPPAALAGGSASARKPLRRVLAEMVEVIGNGRFFAVVVAVLALLVLGSKWLPFRLCIGLALGVVLANLAYDRLLRGRLATRPGTTLAVGFWSQPMRVGEGRYLVFLLLMAGFWTAFNQIFLTLPEYLRDYVDASALTAALPVADSMKEGGQLKPEFFSLLNPFGIIVGQLGISYLFRRVAPLRTIVFGILVTVVSFATMSGSDTGGLVVVSVLVFAVGEMIASPKAKEYAGRIAPPEKVGMYMGYFFWCTALGNLLGGLLSGVMYGHFGPAARGGIDRPDLMWWAFAALSVLTAGSLWTYDRALAARDRVRGR